jgi:tetratricopeptide (TPR) repeat protein
MVKEFSGWLVPILILVVSFSLSAAVAQNNQVCPDMTTNQQILDEGQQYYAEHGGGMGGGPGALFFPAESNFPSQSSTLHSTYSVLGAQVVSDSSLPVFSAEGIDQIALVTVAQMESAELTACYYESIGAHEIARRLYQRILTAMMKNSTGGQNFDHSIRGDLSRIKLYQQANDDKNKKQFAKAVLDYQLILTNIASQKELNLKAKVDLLRPIVSELEKLLYNHVSEAKEALAQAQSLYDQYKQRAIGCLTIAEKLDHVAWKLERDGSYDMAEKLYKQSVEIKEKNLGKNNPYTLSAYGDLARLDADQEHYKDAQNIYEQALASFRRLPDPGTLYASMLQDYGDMLNRSKQAEKANKIYSEAREYLLKGRTSFDSSGKSG